MPSLFQGFLVDEFRQFDCRTCNHKRISLQTSLFGCVSITASQAFPNGVQWWMCNNMVTSPSLDRNTCLFIAKSLTRVFDMKFEMNVAVLHRWFFTPRQNQCHSSCSQGRSQRLNRASEISYTAAFWCILLLKLQTVCQGGDFGCWHLLPPTLC